jgi:hypothetical protein
MNNEKKTKPLIVELEDARAAFVQFINTLQQSGMSCYLIEMALSDTLMQLHNRSSAELALARQQIVKEGHDHGSCGCGCEHEQNGHQCVH